MKKLMKKILILAVTALLATSLTACNGNGGADGGLEDFTFIARIGGDPSSFHPNRIADDFGWPIYQNIFNRLVKLGPNDNVLPDLAYDWHFSEDGLTLTFHLHQGVYWHDGTPFTSSDVQWTYETLIAETWMASTRLAAIDSIDTPDDYTVVMNLSIADASLVSQLAWISTFVMPRHLYEGTDQTTNPHNLSPVGTGPFRFVSWDTGVSVTLERNENFWGHVPYIQTLIFAIISDDHTAFQALVNGEIDFMGALPVAHINDLDDNPDFVIHDQLWINRTYVTFNADSEIFSDPLVRRAVAYAINQQSIVDRVGGAGSVARTFISPLFTDFVTFDYTMPPTDLDRAVELLEEAGFERDANGVFFETTFTIFESGNFVDVATIVQANLRLVGIEVRIEVMEMAAWVTTVLEDANFEMAMLAGYQGPDVIGIAGRVQTGGATNVMRYSNPVLDELIMEARVVTDLDARRAIFRDIQRILYEDLPMILIIDGAGRTPLSTRFVGFPMQVDGAAANEFTFVRKVSH